MNADITNTATGNPHSSSVNGASPAAECLEFLHFSRAQVLGTFLTLQFIHLTQPYGSLLFRGVSGFWWRVNPIASLVEAFLVFWQLALTQLRPQLRRHKWQITAASLLMLRGVVGDEEGSKLIAELLRGTFLDKDEANAPPVVETRTATDLAGQPVGEGTREAGNSETPVQMSFEDSAAQNFEEPTPSQFFKRRNSLLEANSLSDQLDNQPSARESKILHTAFGANALAHREWRIDLVTWLSVAAIFVKLCFISGAVWFRIACFFQLAGWAAIQTLLTLFHRREMANEDRKAAVRLAQVIDKDSGNKIGMFLYLVFHAPFFGYLGYRLSFEPFFPPDTFGLVGMALSALPWTVLFMLGITSLGLAVRMLWTCLLNLMDGELAKSGMDFLGCIIRFCGFLLSIFLAMGSFITWLGNSDENSDLANLKISPKYFFSTYYNSTDPMGLRVVEGTMLAGYVMYNCLWLGFYFAILLGAFFVIFLANDSTMLSSKLDRGRVSVGNFGFTLVIFILYLMHYDEHSTSKPRWLEYLG